MYKILLLLLLHNYIHFYGYRKELVTIHVGYFGFILYHGNHMITEIRNINL